MDLAKACTTAVKCLAIQKDEGKTHSQAKTTRPCDSQTEYDTQYDERAVANTVAIRSFHEIVTHSYRPGAEWGYRLQISQRSQC
jgi:hypothetical protein